MNVLIINPALGFTDLSTTLTAAGWEHQPDPTAPAPLIPDEPELAAWARNDSRLSYRFEPATGLRELSVTGAQAVRDLEVLARLLPCLDLDHARALLDDTEVESQLLALQVIDALNGYILIDRVTEFIAHNDPLVAQQATRTYQRLIAKAGGNALRLLAEWKQQHPEFSALFLLAGDSSNKIQVLRWMMHDRSASNPDMDRVLRTALHDDDWEVRLTAVVVTARLRASKLMAEVRRVHLPQDTADGVNKDERRMLRSFQLAALELLEGCALPAASNQPLTTKEAMHRHILRCLAGVTVPHHDKTFLYITSLSTPLPDEIPLPELLPTGISRLDDRYVLDGYDIALRWIPPITHWLGEDLPRMQVANPIRQQRCPGFFISQELTVAPDVSHGTSPLVCDYRSAFEYCRQLSATTGLAVRLPTADEWEMAARGPDARRFPWGNNARASGRFGPSPWGIIDAVGRLTQWTQEPSNGDVLVCGGKKQWVCAMRELVNKDTFAASLRIVVQEG